MHAHHQTVRALTACTLPQRSRGPAAVYTSTSTASKHMRPKTCAPTSAPALPSAACCPQLAINDAVNSGANPRVTEAAARYGNEQAYLASQATRCGWYGRNWYGNCYGKRK